MNITYHGTTRDYFERLDPAQPYVPPDFEREGFIHTTEGREAVAIILSMYYKDQPGDWLILYIDKDRVSSAVRYDDPAEVFPHIYGPLNREAIIAVRPIARAADGTFLKPDPLDI